MLILLPVVVALSSGIPLLALRFVDNVDAWKKSQKVRWVLVWSLISYANVILFSVIWLLLGEIDEYGYMSSWNIVAMIVSCLYFFVSLIAYGILRSQIKKKYKLLDQVDIERIAQEQPWRHIDDIKGMERKKSDGGIIEFESVLDAIKKPVKSEDICSKPPKYASTQGGGVQILARLVQSNPRQISLSHPKIQTKYN